MVMWFCIGFVLGMLVTLTLCRVACKGTPADQ